MRVLSFFINITYKLKKLKKIFKKNVILYNKNKRNIHHSAPP